MVLGWLWPFGRKSKRRRERFRNWESVPQDYGQGLVTHIIASKTGRSTHTVRSVLTQRGTRPLPERDTEPIDEESAGRTGGVGRRRRRGKRDDAGTLTGAGI